MSYAVLWIATLAATAQVQGTDERTPHELRQAVHAALRESAPAACPDAEITVPRLVALYEEVGAHPTMIAADRTRYQGLLKARLKRLSRQLEKQLPEVDAQAAPVPNNIDPHGHILAQQAANPAAAGFNNANANRNAVPRDITSANAAQLIDLIERTIAPTTWERAGGLGTIRYYAPLRVLVVRQTGEVHDQLGGLIGGLNK